MFWFYHSSHVSGSFLSAKVTFNMIFVQTVVFLITVLIWDVHVLRIGKIMRTGFCSLSNHDYPVLKMITDIFMDRILLFGFGL